MYQGSNGNLPKFTRSSSQICPTPEEELLDAILANNTFKVEQLITRNEHLLSHTYPEYDKRILLIACSEDGVEAKTVEKLLNLNANPRDRTDEEGWEALHLAANKTDRKILKVLLDRNPGDVNTVDLHGNSALQILIRYGARDSPEFLECARLLIERGADVNLRDSKNKTALDWATKRGVIDQIRSLIEATKENQSPFAMSNNNFDASKSEGEQLLNYLKQGDEDAFVHFKNGDIKNWVNYGDGSTLLQFCCQKSLNRAAIHLLSRGADHEKTGTKNNTKPIEIAAEHGNHQIFKALVDKYSSLVDVPKGILPTLLKDSRHVGYRECFKSYMDKIKDCDPDEASLKLNEMDRNGNTALKYAVRYGDPSQIQELLDRGASLGAKNQFDIMPIQDIKPQLLEKHLDNCVVFDVNNAVKVENEEFRIKFNYRTLIPPYATQHVEPSKDAEAAMTSRVRKVPVAETEVISFMANSSEYKHLVKHPVVVSFLLMKWLQIQWLFWLNLFFYVTFVLSLVVYIFSDYSYFTAEDKSAIHSLFASLSYACLVLSLLGLIAREVFQICVAPTKYFKNFENYIEIILIVITSMIVLIRDPSHDTRKQLSSLAILLAAFELVLMLGQHPYYSTNVVMLKTVSFNFFKFLIWYSLLIVAFAMSFYLLFTTNEPDNAILNVKNDTSEADSDDDKSFDNPGKSVFKTIIMLTGEFDASSINFDTFPVTSKVIFALFIFMIAIILLNLLNGLAVSDTQMIKNDAELVGHIARAQHIRYVESMLIGNVLPTTLLNKITDLCCCLPYAGNWNIRIANACFPDVCLFDKYLNYELVFLPNQSGLVVQEKYNKELKKLRPGCLPCASIRLDRDTLKRTHEIVQTRIEEELAADTNKKLELELSELKGKLDEILRTIVNSSQTSNL